MTRILMRATYKLVTRW